MKYAQIRKMDISNGSGIGVSLFTQGCPIHCPECHNKEIWDFDGGNEFTEKTIDIIIELLKPEYITRFSILGGEPLVSHNTFMLSKLIQRIKMEYPNKKIWLYTGYTYEHLKNKANSYLSWILTQGIDILVDGPFIQEQKDITLKFRGSKNQRVIDIKATQENNKIILLDV